MIFSTGIVKFLKFHQVKWKTFILFRDKFIQYTTDQISSESAKILQKRLAYFLFDSVLEFSKTQLSSFTC